MVSVHGLNNNVKGISIRNKRTGEDTPVEVLHKRDFFPKAGAQSRAASRRDAQRSGAPLTGWLEGR
jgi:hypothetical protein